MVSKHGFELVEERYIPEVDSIARYYRHMATGCELLSLVNQDENKVFTVTFRTPTYDSTGVPHIMEHSVLCGSRKYPVKEPFVELMKGSLNTFLNAFTMPDRTLYPVASTNQQDFYNLIDVYLDAVFFPLISEHTLQQEGWHYELEDVDSPLSYKGVVFNEMKGVYSSPEGILGHYTQQAVFPDTMYAHNYGGDPTVIPDLTYQQFREYHDTYYHPSNALLFFYGDDPEDDRLALLDHYLREFIRKNIEAGVKIQPPFKSPRRKEHTYDAGDGPNENHHYISINWLLPEIRDPELMLSLDVLSHVLLSSPASPLRKTLLDSGLGDELVGGGMSSYLRQPVFETGLRGVSAENVDKVENLVLETLKSLSEQGFDPDTIAASINTIEFGLREKNTGSYPRGLILLMQILPGWLYREDPFEGLGFEKELAAVKQKLAQDSRYLESLLQEYILNNPHCATVIMRPESGLGEKITAAEAEKLANLRQQFSEEDLQNITANAETLQRLQETPDTAEALASIPRLEIADLDKEVKTIPLAESVLAGVKTLTHDLFTNHILYLDLVLDLHGLPQRLLPYIPLFGRALIEIGTEKEDDVRLAQRIGRYTGGISAGPMVSARLGNDGEVATLIIRGKATFENVEELLAILTDILLRVKLDQRDRFRQMVLEARASTESHIQSAGHLYSNYRLKAHYLLADQITEKMNGISSLFFLRELVDRIDRDWPAILADLEEIRSRLVNRNQLLVNVTLPEADWNGLRGAVEGFLVKLPELDIQPEHWSFESFESHEAFTFPTQVNYVGKGKNLYQTGYNLNGGHLVAAKYLNTSYIWDKIRVQGGAYGGFAVFDQVSGMFSYLSYRDPNLMQTLDSYDGTVEFLRNFNLNDEELIKAVIGVIGSLDAYELPPAKGQTSLRRYLIGIGENYRQKIRDEVLNTSVEDFHSFAEVLEKVRKSGDVVVLGSTPAVDAANQPSAWLAVQKIL